MEYLLVAASIAFLGVVCYFSGYKHGKNDAQNISWESSAKCSCGEVTWYVKSASPERMKHYTPPRVCQPSRETLKEDF